MATTVSYLLKAAIACQPTRTWQAACTGVRMLIHHKAHVARALEGRLTLRME